MCEYVQIPVFPVLRHFFSLYSFLCAFIRPHEKSRCLLKYVIYMSLRSYDYPKQICIIGMNSLPNCCSWQRPLPSSAFCLSTELSRFQYVFVLGAFFSFLFLILDSLLISMKLRPIFNYYDIYFIWEENRYQAIPRLFMMIEIHCCIISPHCVFLFFFNDFAMSVHIQGLRFQELWALLTLSLMHCHFDS